MAVIRKSDAIVSLDTNCKFSVKNNDVVTFVDDTYDNPTDAEINTEVTRLQAIEDYQAPRRAGYPSIGDQLDMIYHNGDGGATFQAAIKAVKDKYPKP
jgi:hypothetical protein